MPVSAQTITHDSRRPRRRRGEDPAGTARCRPTARCPPTGGDFPIVLVVQEIFGVHEHIEDVCRRFAKRGYLAIAPELFVRQGDARSRTATSPGS